MREAVFLSVDIAGIADLQGMASVPQGQLGPKGTIGFNDAVQPYTYDPERAMALLAEAKADGVDVDALNVEVVGRDTTPRIKPIVEAIGAMLNISGIETTIKVQTPQEFNPRVRIAGYARRAEPANDAGSRQGQPLGRLWAASPLELCMPEHR